MRSNRSEESVLGLGHRNDRRAALPDRDFRSRLLHVQQPELHRVHAHSFGHFIHHLFPGPLELLLGVAPRRARASSNSSGRGSRSPLQLGTTCRYSSDRRRRLRLLTRRFRDSQPVLTWNSRWQATIFPSLVAPTLNLVSVLRLHRQRAPVPGPWKHHLHRPAGLLGCRRSKDRTSAPAASLRQMFRHSIC